MFLELFHIIAVDPIPISVYLFTNSASEAFANTDIYARLISLSQLNEYAENGQTANAR